MPPTKARRLSLSRAICGWNGKDIPRVRRREHETARTDTGIKGKMSECGVRRGDVMKVQVNQLGQSQQNKYVWELVGCSLLACLLAAVYRAREPESEACAGLRVGLSSSNRPEARSARYLDLFPLRGTCLVRPASVAARGHGGMRGWPLLRWLQGRLRRCRRSGCSVASAADVVVEEGR